MADITPFRALHYDLARTGGLAPVVAPPYDVIDPQQREALLARSPHNVVAIDLPQAGDDPYAHRRRHARGLARRRRRRRRRRARALGARAGLHRARTARRRTRHGIFARVSVEDYGAGRIRPHERTHPGPKEDRLRLTRATHANLSPIFSLYDGDAWTPLAPHLQGEPLDDVTDEDGTTHRLWRVADAAAIEAAARPRSPPPSC